MSPSATGCSSPAVNETPPPVRLNMFVMLIVIDTN